MQRHHTRREWGVAVAALVCMVAASGCIQDKPEFEVDRGSESLRESEERVGAVYTEFRRVDSSRATQREHRARLHAQFLDVRGLEAETALSALDIWQYPSSLDRDTCALSSGHAARSGQGDQTGRFRMRLLDVGPLRVETKTGGMTLEPRRIPDLSRTFSGVVYGLDETMQTSSSSAATEPPLPYRPGETYQFSAPGGRGTAGFEVALQAPEPLRIESIQGQSSSEQWQHLGTKSAVSVGWEAPEDRATGGDTGDSDIFMDVAAVDGQGHLTCRLADDGQFMLPSELVDEVASDGSMLTFVLRRVRSRQVEVPGLDETRLTISATDVRRVALDTLRE